MKPSGDKFDPMMGETACDVLENLRRCFKTRNFSPALGYTEELQAMFDRMESALHQYGSGYGSPNRIRADVNSLKTERRGLRVEVVKLENARDELKEQIASNTDDLEKIGAEVVQTLATQLDISLATAGGVFKLLRKRGIIFMKDPNKKKDNEAHQSD